MGGEGGGFPGMESQGLSGPHSVKKRGVRQERRGYHYSRLDPGTQIPTNQSTLDQIYQALNGDGPNMKRFQKPGWFSQPAGGTVINNYGNQYHRGDSLHLMRLAEAV
jgi:hypothetical protein